MFIVINSLTKHQIYNWVQLLRWDKPSGRIILLIPAGWSLWLTPTAPPSPSLLLLIIGGGFFVSGAGCIANDLWDRNFDKEVERTKGRPLAQGLIKISTAYAIFFVMLLLSFFVVLSLPLKSQEICLKLAICSLPPILLYPSAKRWCKYPQIILSLCWGFSVLIPWAASQASLNGGWPLLSCWIATMTWTFGFDTVYAMADRKEDERLGLNSTALNLGESSTKVISYSYAITSFFLALSAISASVNWIFWPLWLIASIGMQREVSLLKSSTLGMSLYRRHFKHQVWLGSLILLGLILGRLI